MGDMMSSLLSSGASVIGSGASVYNSERQISAQQKSQASQNAWQSAENEKDRLWQQQEWLRQFTKQNEQWKKQFDIQNEYNDPSAIIERLRNAGINPAAAIGQLSGTGGLAAAGGSGQVSSPGQFPSHSVMPIGLQNPTSVFNPSDMLQGISSLINARTNAKRLGLDTDYQNATLESVVEKLKADKQYQEKAAALQDTMNIIQKAVGQKHIQAKIDNLLAQAALYDSQGKTQESQQALNYAMEVLTKTKNGIIQEVKPLLITNLSRIGSLYKSETVLNYAKADESHSSAAHLDALTKTIDDMRDGQIYGQTLSNEISEFNKKIISRQNDFEEATYADKLWQFALVAREQGYITEKAKVDLQKAMQDKDWNQIEHFMSCLESATRSFSNVAKPLNGAQRNSIAEKFNELYSSPRYSRTEHGMDSRGHKTTKSASWSGDYKAPWQR